MILASAYFAFQSMAFYNFHSTYQVVVLVFITCCCFQSKNVSSFEYQVGDKNIFVNNWAVPPQNNTNMYNDWASGNRFTVGDSIHFRYKKDSVMEVNNTDYKTCNSKRPHFFSNTGNTVFNLNRSGAFYFISGATGHCDMGQRMIVKVMASDDSSCGGPAVSIFAYMVIVAYAFSYYF